tara:strand:+ start:172 stop:1869 length:1698 start_codon:yes stop_codon:yes gene_type:complete
MPDLSLQYLIRIYEPNVENIKFRIVRHVVKGRGLKNYLSILLLLFIFGCSDDSLNTQNSKPKALADTIEIDLTNFNEIDSQTSVFISSVEIQNINPSLIKNIRFTIESQPGSVAKNISAVYPISELLKDNKTVIPIFGLYSDYLNSVIFDITFIDNSVATSVINIQTDEFIDPNNLEQNLTITRSAIADLIPFSFFVLKPKSDRPDLGFWSPIIMDIDGKIRWVRSKPSEEELIINPISRATTFNDNKFIFLSEPNINNTEPSIIKYGLDGNYTVSTIFGANYKLNNLYFSHHDIRYGKSGYLVELNVESETEGYLMEQVVAEISDDGMVLNEFDFGQIISQHMLNNSDNPKNFVINPKDWFHSNSVLYDSSDNSLIVSSRENFIIKVGFDDKQIKWIFGDESKKWFTNFISLRELSLKSQFVKPMGQHSLQKYDGNLMFFNNGTPSFLPENTPAGDSLSSSLLQMFIIEEDSAEEVWSYDANLLSPICSSVDKYSGKSDLDIFLLNYSSVDWIRGVNSGPNAKNRNIIQIIDENKTLLFEMSIPTSNCWVSWNTDIIYLENINF